MLDIGWPELFVIGVITLLVVGPRELPKVLRTVSQLVRRARSLASEFQRGVDDMVRDSELSELKKGLTDVNDPSVIERFADEIDGDRSIRKALEPAEELRAPVERDAGPSKTAGQMAPAHSVTPPADPFETVRADGAAAAAPADQAAGVSDAGSGTARQDDGDDIPDEKPAAPSAPGGASVSG